MQRWRLSVCVGLPLRRVSIFFQHLTDDSGPSLVTSIYFHFLRPDDGQAYVNFTCAHTHERTRVCVRTHTHHMSVRVCVCVCVQTGALLWFRQPDDLLPVLPRIDDDVRTCWTSFQHGLHGTLSCHGDIYGGTSYWWSWRTDGLGGWLHTTHIQPTYIPHKYKSVLLGC